MELVEISKEQLKVILTPEDLAFYKIDIESTAALQESKCAFLCMMDEIKAKTGFDIAGACVSVEIYESKGGGCEMFVTKTAGKEGSPGDKDKSRIGGERKEMVYSFQTMELLLKMCRQLARLGYPEKSEAYALPGRGTCYLIIREKMSDSAISRNALSEYAFLSEYGKRKEGALARAYIKEHAKELSAPDAVNTLARL